MVGRCLRRAGLAPIPMLARTASGALAQAQSAAGASAPKTKKVTPHSLREGASSCGCHNRLRATTFAAGAFGWGITCQSTSCTLRMACLWSALLRASRSSRATLKTKTSRSHTRNSPCGRTTRMGGRQSRGWGAGLAPIPRRWEGNDRGTGSVPGARWSKWGKTRPFTRANPI